MKKVAFIISCMLCFAAVTTQAQHYKTGLGLVGEASGVGTFGFDFKYYPSEKTNVEANILFGNGVTSVSGYLQRRIALASEVPLDANLGGGITVGFGKSYTLFGLRPSAGLEYVFTEVPISISLEWRPGIFFGNGSSNFDGGIFDFGVRYTLK